jgi:hypothetical protein
MSYASFGLTFLGLGMLTSGFLSAGIILFPMGLALIIGMFLYYWHWRQKREQEITYTLNAWSQRYGELCSRMERFLEEL